MVTAEDCILGNGILHEQFFATTEILAKLVSSAPRAVSMAALESETGRTAQELSKHCNSLARAGLLRQDGSSSGKWSLTCDASSVTLEDVFRCVLTEQQKRPRASGKATADRAYSDVDLLLMQAMIEINQSVCKQLRQFSLDRLKASAAGMFPSQRGGRRNARFHDDLDPLVSGREAGPVSPEQIPA